MPWLDGRAAIEQGCGCAIPETIESPRPGGVRSAMNLFDKKLEQHGRILRRGRLETLQINVGRKCNQSCAHCHVDAGPWRTEMMSHEVAHRVGDWICAHPPAVVDLTGGAPELSEHFPYFVELATANGSRVIDRNNLTIIETSGFAWLPEYLARHRVEIVASLPCYLEENVDTQRGAGVFAKSISALRKLNAVGYGTTLPLSLIYNPLGPRLPPPQHELESDYRAALRERYGVEFTQLYTLANQPIARFAEDLRRRGCWDEYLELLANSFNPLTVDQLMCRFTVSVGWTGEIYDCDFNQMLSLPLGGARPVYLWDVTPDGLAMAGIQTGVHCLACTAGAGSSCTGALDSPG
jgi:radical SAM/Cys-rich protein